MAIINKTEYDIISNYIDKILNLNFFDSHLQVYETLKSIEKHILINDYFEASADTLMTIEHLRGLFLNLFFHEKKRAKKIKKYAGFFKMNDEGFLYTYECVEDAEHLIILLHNENKKNIGKAGYKDILQANYIELLETLRDMFLSLSYLEKQKQK